MGIKSEEQEESSPDMSFQGYIFCQGTVDIQHFISSGIKHNDLTSVYITRGPL